MKHISKLKPWSLESVLTDKYGWTPGEANTFASFLTPMLEFDPNKRAKAHECLLHPFLAEI